MSHGAKRTDDDDVFITEALILLRTLCRNQIKSTQSKLP